MHIRAPAILLSARHNGETAVVARFFTADFGVVAAYVAGGRGRQLRPLVMPGNSLDVQITARSESRLPFAKVELLASRGAWLGEPLAAAAIGWACALTATVLPERQAYPALYQALEGLLGAICHAPSARGWAAAMAGYEALLLRDLGYGGNGCNGGVPDGNLAEVLAVMDALAGPLEHNLLAGTGGDVMAARARLRELLGRMI